MADFNARQYTSFRGINLLAENGVLRFVAPDSAPVTTSGELLLYVDGSNNLIYNNGVSAVTLGAAGGGGGAASTWDAIYAGDKTMVVGNGTMTFEGNSADGANVFTLTNIAGSTGAAIQITNATTSNPDIKGTSDTWKVLGTGAATFLGVTITGVASGTSAMTFTAGDLVLSDGQLSVTRVGDNAVTLTVVNNSATSASSVVISGSGAFTGNTTSSFMTLTPSGLTSGTALYLPVAALTTGKAVHIVANAYSDGLVFNLTSSSTAATSTGRLFNLAHTATLNVSHVIAEMATAAQDETVLLKLTASDILALGRVLQVSASSLTTGKGITVNDLDALTTGMGVHIASAATAITTTGRLFLSDHTGSTGSTATLNEFKTAATDETVLLALTTAAMIDGVALSIVGTTGMTTGSLLRLTSSTAGLVATNGVVSLSATGAFTSTSGIAGGFVEIKANTTTAGTIFNLLGTALTTGVAVSISNGTAATTSGSLLRVAAGGIGAVATNGIVSFTHTGIYTSASAVDGGFVEVKANATTAGTVVNVVSSGITTGIGLQLSNGTSAITSGSLLRVTGSGTGTLATNGLVSITHGGIFVSTSNAGVLDVRASAMVGTASNGTLVNFMTTAALQVDTTVLNVENSGFTTGYIGSMLRVKSVSTTGACRVVDVIADGITSGGIAMKISVAALTTGDGLVIDNGTAATTTGSLLKVTAGGTGAVSSDGIVSFQHSGVYTSTTVGFVNVSASATTGGSVMTVTGALVTDGVGLQISNAAITTGKHLNILGAAGSSMFSVSVSGATVIAGVALGTAALTVTAGDLVLSSGKITVVGGILSSAPTGAGIGYSTGAGATVTQLTNRSTGVTINTLCGKIQTDTTSLAALASAEFTVTNSTVAIGDVVVVSQRSGSSNVAGVAGTTLVEVVTVAAGSFIISVNNQSTTTAETGAIIINFAVIKAVTA